MIVGCYERLEIGARYFGVSDTSGNYHRDQPFIVLREASLQEYTQDAPFIPEEHEKTGSYYEISVD